MIAQTEQEINQEVADLRAQLADIQQREVGLQRYCREVLRQARGEKDMARSSGIAQAALIHISICGIYVRPESDALRRLGEQGDGRFRVEKITAS